MARIPMRLALAGLMASLFTTASFGDSAFESQFQTLLDSAQIDAAQALAQDRLTASPGDAQAQFALGTAQFLGAVEGLGQALYDYGLTTARTPDYYAEITDLPFLRLPVGVNLDLKKRFTALAFRQILDDFDDQLLEAEATLALVPKGAVSLPLTVQGIAFDYNRDGKVGHNETLPSLVYAISGTDLSPSFPKVGFDESDVTWLRGYAHLLAGITDILLAHDWTETVNQTFQEAFPKAGLPSAALLEGRLLGQWRNEGGIGDIVAFVHLFNWPVLEPKRLLSARMHFLSMIRLSRESWVSIRAETDDAGEWVPGPHQTGPFANLKVTEATVAGWMDFLDQAEGVLEGRLLLAHWRFPATKGLNLRRMFEEPRTLDPVLILTGPGAIPYIETGPLAPGSTFGTGMDLLGGGMLAYFLWFN
jgi:hypothetical protein